MGQRSCGIPLVSEKDRPHVYWSVPKSWFPGGILFSGPQITALFRHLSRLPKSAARNQLLESVLKFLPTSSTAGAGMLGAPQVVAAASTEREERFLPIVEDAADQRVSLRFAISPRCEGASPLATRPFIA